uniref:Uncharacterized protein n=1 Tax=Parascaris equorum TaxID=6256 RepID=A0A914RKW3_PAREQ
MQLEGAKYYLFQFYQLIVVVAIVCVSFVVYLLRRYSQVEANEPKKAVPESKSKQSESEPDLKQQASKAQAPKPSPKAEGSSEEEEEEGEVVTPLLELSSAEETYQISCGAHEHDNSESSEGKITLRVTLRKTSLQY